MLNFATCNANQYSQNNNKVKIMRKFLITMLSFLVLPMFFACNKDRDENLPADDNFKLLAIVKNVTDVLSVEIIESDYAFGEYWVITPEDIKYTGKMGEEISRSDIKPGDKLEICYRGQVMMSYPPKISATAIKIVE